MLCQNPAAELLQYFAGRVLRLAVDELEQHAPLRAGHLFQYGGVFRLYLVVDSLDVGFLGLFRRQAAQFRLHVGHFLARQLRHGVDLLHGIDQLAVAAQVDRAAEDVDGQHVERGNRVAPLLDPLAVPEARTASLGRGARGGEQRQQCDEKSESAFHDRKKYYLCANIPIISYNV